MRNLKHQNDRFTALTACLLAAAATGLFAAPSETTARLRAAIRDAAFPGHRAVSRLRAAASNALERWQPVGATDAEFATLKTELAQQQLLCRQFKLVAASANARLAAAKREGVSPYAATKGNPLVVPHLIEAAVLGDDAAAAFRGLQLIDRGATAGVAESDLILQSDATLIDQGQDAGLAADQAIYAGRTVVGKVRDAGRWTSTIERVSDVDYRGHAQIMWQSSDGPVYRAEGILEGRGDGTCRLSNVAATAAVSVGDEVYTARQTGALPHPMFYGTVIEADLTPGALFWDVVVKPAAADLELTTVQVLTTQRNPLRPLAH